MSCSPWPRAAQKSFALSDDHGDVVGAFAAGDTLTALSGSTAYDPYGQQVATHRHRPPGRLPG